MTLEDFGILNRLLPNADAATLEAYDVLREKGHLRDAYGFQAFKVDQHSTSASGSFRAS
jgi:hypothetical protein